MFGFDGALYLDLLSRYLLCVLSNYSSVSATTTIHLLTQLFTLDCLSCIFLGMMSADVEGGGNFPGEVVTLAMVMMNNNNNNNNICLKSNIQTSSVDCAQILILI